MRQQGEAEAEAMARAECWPARHLCAVDHHDLWFTAGSSRFECYYLSTQQPETRACLVAICLTGQLKVEVTFHIDEHGVLNVTAHDLDHGKQEQVRLEACVQTCTLRVQVTLSVYIVTPWGRALSQHCQTESLQTLPL
jgi:hypothetical protein